MCLFYDITYFNLGNFHIVATPLPVDLADGSQNGRNMLGKALGLFRLMRFQLNLSFWYRQKQPIGLDQLIILA